MSVRPPPGTGPWSRGGVPASGPYRYYSPRLGRPLGISLLSLVVGIAGLVAFLTGLIMLLMPFVSFPATTFFAQTVEFYTVPLTLTSSLVLFIGGVVALSVANGLWHQERWALWVGAGATVAVEAVFFFRYVPFSYAFLALWVLYVYLLAVRRHFY